MKWNHQKEGKKKSYFLLKIIPSSGDYKSLSVGHQCYFSCLKLNKLLLEIIIGSEIRRRS
jgi:hypothetical protein